MNRIRPLRYLAMLASLPLFALLFWITAFLLSNLPGLLAIGVNVHGLSLASYAGDTALRPAPLSLRVFQDAQQDAGGPGASLLSGTPNPIASGSVHPTPSHPASPTPAPSPTPTAVPLSTPTPLPLPTPTVLPTPLPTAAPTPSVLPSPLPTLPLPTVPPGLLPGLLP